MIDDIKFLKLAIENSRKSMKKGNFPAGAVVVKNNKVIASEVSSPYPGLFHADSKAVTSAFNKYGVLTGGALYVGLESCLMCATVAYWAGIERIVYAVRKIKVSADYYETPKSAKELFKTLNRKIKFIHIKGSEKEALAVIREWEKKRN
jgi:tRNA(Arg) A34 adenosine deaminase TadA